MIKLKVKSMNDYSKKGTAKVPYHICCQNDFKLKTSKIPSFETFSLNSKMDNLNLSISKFRNKVLKKEIF